MKIYNSEDFQVEIKDDSTPLTIADKNANDRIMEFLIPTEIKIISEENKQLAYEDRKNWEVCWIVDPLDGTKEFIKNGTDFTDFTLLHPLGSAHDLQDDLHLKARPRLAIFNAGPTEIDYLKVYIRRLRQKLEGDPENIGQIISERGVGYKFVAA